MAADSNSMIAWHRAQIRKHREALKHLETAKFNFGEIAGGKAAGAAQRTAAELKRKIRESEQIVAAHEREIAPPAHHRLPDAGERAVGQVEREWAFGRG